MKAIQPNKMAATRGMQSIRKTMPMTTLRLFIIVEGFRRHDSNTCRQKTHFYRTGVSLCRGGLKDGERKPATGGWRAGGRARDARGKFITTRVFHRSIKYPSNKTCLSQTLLQRHLATFRLIIFPSFDPFQQVPSK